MLVEYKSEHKGMGESAKEARPDSLGHAKKKSQEKQFRNYFFRRLIQ